MKDLVRLCMQNVYKKFEQEVIAICNSPILSKIMLGEYEKQKFNIEDFPKEDKQKLWDEIKILLPGKTKQQLIDACKIVYTINQLHEKNLY